MTKPNSRSLTTYFVIGIAAFTTGIVCLGSFADQPSADRERGQAVANAVDWLTLGLGVILIPMGIAMLVWAYVLYRRAQHAKSDFENLQSTRAQAARAQAAQAEASQVQPALTQPVESAHRDN